MVWWCGVVWCQPDLMFCSVLQLVSRPGQEEWAEFLHTGDRKFDFQEVMQEITEETDRETEQKMVR